MEMALAHTTTVAKSRVPELRAFAKLSERAYRELMAELQRYARRVVAGNVVLQDGEENERVLIVLDGWMAITKCLEDGESQIIDFALPGDVLDPSSGDGHTSGVTLEVVSDARVSLLPNARWHRLLSDHPQLAHYIANVAGAAQARMSERMLRLGKGSAQTRIAHTLIELCVRLKAAGQTVECQYHLPLTQKDIGDFVGLSSVHVCRTLRRLERAGIIDVTDHIDVKILDIDALAEIAQIDPARLAAEATPART
ncbi:MAG: Crp/Fnr family transcriptional regulator [Pseudomonadota bacterium]